MTPRSDQSGTDRRPRRRPAPDGRLRTEDRPDEWTVLPEALATPSAAAEPDAGGDGRHRPGDARGVLRGAIPPWRRLLPSVLFGALSAGSAVALIACSAWLITRAAEQPPVMYLGMAVVGVRAFALGRAAFRYAERLSGHDASFRQLAVIRAGVFERLVPIAPDGLAGSRRGDLLARFTADVDELQFVPLRAVQPVVSAGLVLVAALVGIGLLDPAAALAETAVLAVGILVAVAAQRLAGRRADRELAPARGALRAAVVEHLDALDALVAFDADAADRDRIRRLGERLQRAVRRRSAAQGVANAVTAALGGLGALTGILIAAPRLADGGLTGPAFAVICLVPLAMAEVAAAIPIAGSAWRTGRVAAERVARVAPETPPAGVAVDPAEPRPLPEPAGAPELVLAGLSAHWPAAVGDERPPSGLARADLVIRPGERLLVRGPSGAGKTTLAHVLVRFLGYDGSYRIDGVEADAVAGDAVRERIGLVEQRPWLFDESIRHNLDFAAPEAGDAELTAVLERVGLADWTAERGGLDAPVGERGGLVSGGQAQRLALARAMLRGFPVLVLDEPTANVDAPLAERLLADLLDAADADGRTLVCIAHAEVDESRFDRVIEVAAGRTPA